MRGNFREDSKMPTGSRHCPESQYVFALSGGSRATVVEARGEGVPHFPLLIHLLFEIPMTAAFFTCGLKDCMRILPFSIERSLPHGLRFRSYKNISAKTFKLQSIAAVN